MFGTIRKHQTWLWAIIITLTIISFLFFFSPYSRMDQGRGKANYGTINGEKITEGQFAEAWREVQLRYFFMSGGRWADEDARKMGFDPERETYQWLLLLQKLREANIHVAPDTAAQMGRRMIDRFQSAGITSPSEFFTRVLEPRGISVADFERYLDHSLGMQELLATIGVSGKLISPQEAQSLYTREHQEVSAEALFFNGTNYLAQVNLTPEAVAQYYSNNLSQFRIPERLQVNYVQFTVSNSLAEAEAELTKTNLSSLVDMNFQRLGTNYTQYGATPDEAKAKIKEQMIKGQALVFARRKANEFANELYAKEALLASNLEAVAQAKGLPVQVSLSFDRRSGPLELSTGPDFVNKAFALTTNDPFAGPLVGSDAVYVISLNKRIPSEVPPLDQVQERATSEYKRQQSISLARAAAFAANTTITNGLAQNKAFAAICAEANLTPTIVPPISLSTRSLPGLEERISLSELKQAVFGTEPGKTSAVQMTADGAAMVFVKAKLPLDEAKMKTELPNFLATVKQQRQSEAFNEWFKKESDRGLRDTPVAQPKPPPSMGAAAKKT
jgi:peptidyl-prolyl cis-trans isomerase D